MTSSDFKSAQLSPNTGFARVPALRLTGRAARAIVKSKTEDGTLQASPHYTGMEQL